MDSEASSLIGQLSYRISALEKKINFLFKHLNIEYKEPVEAYITAAKNLLLQNKEIQAVKLVRDEKNCGLAEAQKTIDELKKTLL
jgi:ribosomal protein L7/L12